MTLSWAGRSDCDAACTVIWLLLTSPAVAALLASLLVCLQHRWHLLHGPSSCSRPSLSLHHCLPQDPGWHPSPGLLDTLLISSPDGVARRREWVIIGSSACNKSRQRSRITGTFPEAVTGSRCGYRDPLWQKNAVLDAPYKVKTLYISQEIVHGLPHIQPADCRPRLSRLDGLQPRLLAGPTSKTLAKQADLVGGWHASSINNCGSLRSCDDPSFLLRRQVQLCGFLSAHLFIPSCHKPRVGRSLSQCFYVSLSGTAEPMSCRAGGELFLCDIE